MNQSGINFNWPEDLEYFLNAFENIIPKSYWRVVTYTIEQSAVLDEWEVAYKNIKNKKGKKAKPTGATGQGHARLELIHPEEASIKAIQKENKARGLEIIDHYNKLNSLPTEQKKRLKVVSKYSSNSLSFLIHMMGIMMMNKASNQMA